MDLFTEEFNSIASTQLFPDTKLSCFGNFFTEHLNLEEQ